MRQTCSPRLQNSISRSCIIKNAIEAMTNSLSSIISLISLVLYLSTYSSNYAILQKPASCCGKETEKSEAVMSCFVHLDIVQALFASAERSSRGNNYNHVHRKYSIIVYLNWTESWSAEMKEIRTVSLIAVTNIEVTNDWHHADLAMGLCVLSVYSIFLREK